MGHTHNFQISGWGCQILPWSWDSRSRLIGISQGGRYRRGVSSENQVWEGQNGLWEGDGHRSPSLCIGLPESALLVEMRTNLHSATDGRMHLCPESSGNLGRTRAGIGTTLEKQRGSLPLRQTDSKFGLPSDGSTSTPGLSFCLDRKSSARFNIPGTWTALKERNLPWDQRRKRHAILSRVRDREPPWRFMWDTTAILSVLTITWYFPRTGRKCIKARKTALSSRQFMCQERNSPVHSPCAGLPSKTAPQPVIDASVRDHMATVNCTHSDPTLEESGSRHCKRGRKQLRDTLIRRVAGIVGCSLSPFIHQRNGLMWSNPRGNTGEAAAMRPSNLRQVLTETWWPSLKRARHAVKLDIQAGAKRACIWMESKWTPKNTVRWEGKRTLFLAFIRMPWNLKGASAASMHFVNVLGAKARPKGRTLYW